MNWPRCVTRRASVPVSRNRARPGFPPRARVGGPFPVTGGLDGVWGFQPSFAALRRMLDVFAFGRSLVNDVLAQVRCQASIRPGFQESFSAMFPAPRQRWVDAMASREQDIRA